MGKVILPVKSKFKEIEDVQSLDYLLIERRFGKTSHFALVDPETKEYELIENQNKHLGGSKHTPNIISETGADTVIASHMGSGAYNGILSKGIKILKGDLNVPVSILVEKYNSEVLEAFTSPTVHKSDDEHHH